MVSTREKILDSIRPIIERAQCITIDTVALEQFADRLKAEKIPPWNNDLQFFGSPEETAHYYFFLDSINFCFWAPKGKERWSYRVNGEWLSGYYAYSSAIKDAFLRDKRFFDSTYLSTIPEEHFLGIFDGKNELLLLPERLRILRENFTILAKELGGNILTLVEKSNGDVDVFIESLLRHFSSFRDTAEHNGQTVYFLKRAQILPSDLSFALPQYAPVQFSNMEHLTAFADYKLPQILEAFGVLRYTDELRRKIVDEELIPAGSQEELELRAFTIVAIEKIREYMNRGGGVFSTHEIDWMLWVKTKQEQLPRPHHKTLTTFY